MSCTFNGPASSLKLTSRAEQRFVYSYTTCDGVMVFREKPGLGGEIISPLWPGKASGSPSHSWVMWEREVWGPLLELLPPGPDPG